MMRTRYATWIASITACLLSGWVMAQGENTTFNWKFEEANKLMEERFYNQAAEIWKTLQETQPDNANLNWKAGFAYMSSYNQKNKALPYLKTASEKRNANGYGSFNT